MLNQSNAIFAIRAISQRFAITAKGISSFFLRVFRRVRTRDHPYVSPTHWATRLSSLNDRTTETWIYSHWLKWVCLDIWISQRLFQLLLFLLYYTTDSSVLYIIFFIFIQSIDRGIYTLPRLLPLYLCFSLGWVGGFVGFLFWIFHFIFYFFYFFSNLFFEFIYYKINCQSPRHILPIHLNPPD